MSETAARGTSRHGTTFRYSPGRGPRPSRHPAERQARPSHRAGLEPLTRHAALLAGLRDGQLTARPSFFQLETSARPASGASHGT